MQNKNDIISMQFRMPKELHTYVKAEANRIGISQNAFMLILIDEGRRHRYVEQHRTRTPPSAQ